MQETATHEATRFDGVMEARDYLIRLGMEVPTDSIDAVKNKANGVYQQLKLHRTVLGYARAKDMGL